jgi:Domain of unknown function (DUF1963)
LRMQPALPRSGYLFFFGDLNETADWNEREPKPGAVSPSDRVIFTPYIGVLTAPPNDIPDIGHSEDGSGGGYSEGFRIAMEHGVTGYVIDTVIGLKSPNPDDPDFQIAARALMEASMERAAGPNKRLMTNCQMLGAPENVNGSAGNWEKCEERGDVLLLQLPKAFEHVMMDGKVQFWINATDLAAGNFDRAFGTIRH